MSKVKMEFNKQEMLDLMENANDETKAVLMGMIGTENLALGVEDKIKDVADAYAELGLPQLSSDAFPNLREPYRTRAMNYYDLSIVARALNGEWNVNHKQKNSVFVPVFRYRKITVVPGIVFEFVESQEIEIVNNGVHISFKSREISDYAGRQFTDLFRLI